MPMVPIAVAARQVPCSTRSLKRYIADGLDSDRLGPRGGYRVDVEVVRKFQAALRDRARQVRRRAVELARAEESPGPSASAAGQAKTESESSAHGADTVPAADDDHGEGGVIDQADAVEVEGGDDEPADQVDGGDDTPEPEAEIAKPKLMTASPRNLGKAASRSERPHRPPLDAGPLTPDLQRAVQQEQLLSEAHSLLVRRIPTDKADLALWGAGGLKALVAFSRDDLRAAIEFGGPEFLIQEELGPGHYEGVFVGAGGGDLLRRTYVVEDLEAVCRDLQHEQEEQRRAATKLRHEERMAEALQRQAAATAEARRLRAAPLEAARGRWARWCADTHVREAAARLTWTRCQLVDQIRVAGRALRRAAEEGASTPDDLAAPLRTQLERAQEVDLAEVHARVLACLWSRRLDLYPLHPLDGRVTAAVEHLLPPVPPDPRYVAWQA